MSTPEDLTACQCRNSEGYPTMMQATAPGAAITIGRDSNSTQANGASIVWREQAQKWLVPIIVLLIFVLTANGLVMGANLSEQTDLRRKLRDVQVSEDLHKYEAQQVRVQAELNQELIKVLGVMRGCSK